jgi:hypothetical protein
LKTDNLGGEVQTLPPVARNLNLKLEINRRASPKAFLREEGQGIAEYATMLGIILVLALGVVRLFETNTFQMLLQIAGFVR